MVKTPILTGKYIPLRRCKCEVFLRDRVKHLEACLGRIAELPSINDIRMAEREDRSIYWIGLIDGQRKAAKIAKEGLEQK